MNIEQLIQLSPVPVDFKKGISHLGIYYHKNMFTGYPPYIEITNGLGKYRKMAVLAHEIGHAKCGKKNCKCISQTNHTLAETHAFKFELNWLLKHKQKRGLKASMKVINNCIDRSGCHNRAAKHIMKLKLWQKCLDYVK